jgi:hypothetical protein
MKFGNQVKIINGNLIKNMKGLKKDIDKYGLCLKSIQTIIIMQKFIIKEHRKIT